MSGISLIARSRKPPSFKCSWSPSQTTVGSEESLRSKQTTNIEWHHLDHHLLILLPKWSNSELSSLSFTNNKRIHKPRTPSLNNSFKISTPGKRARFGLTNLKGSMERLAIVWKIGWMDGSFGLNIMKSRMDLKKREPRLKQQCNVQQQRFDRH